jgi:PAS domain S-box-containing protein
MDPETAARLLAATSDVTLVIDAGGVIRDLAIGSDSLPADSLDEWVGRPWLETVTVESRRKIEDLLRDAAGNAPARWRQVSHSTPAGEVAMLYSALPIGSKGRVVAIGRDLRPVAALQQRLLDVQQSMERDYLRLRHAEARYRLLFQMASEAVLIVDAANQRVVEANPAAARLLGENVRKLAGRAFPEGFELPGTQALQRLLGRGARRRDPEEILVRLADGGTEFRVVASLFRQDDASDVPGTPEPGRQRRQPCSRTRPRTAPGRGASPDCPTGSSSPTRTGSCWRPTAPSSTTLSLPPRNRSVASPSTAGWVGPASTSTPCSPTSASTAPSGLFATALRGEYGGTTTWKSPPSPQCAAIRPASASRSAT